MKHSECKVGQEVSFRHKGVTWIGRIVKVNPKNVKVSTTSPKVVRYNVAPAFLRLTSGSSVPAPAPTALPKVYDVGTVVTYTLVEGLFVVIGHHASTHRIARLGGEGGRYYRSIDGTELERVNFELAGV